MKLNEFFNTDRAIFTNVFEPNFPELYQTIFGTIDPNLLDSTLLMRYGNRTLALTFNNDNYKALINSVITINGDSWEKQAQAFNVSYNVAQGASVESEKTISGTTDDNSTGVDENQDITFNNSEYGNNERTNRTNTANRKSEQKETYRQSGNLGGSNIIENVTQEVKLRQNNLRAQVIKELVNEITLQIYE